jgi:oxygen-independent coproporphyrinogen-3 oxidase
MSNQQFTSIPSILTNSFGIYVHIPFCVHKCSYCDFYSFTKYEVGDFAQFTHVLCREAEQAKSFLESWGVELQPVKSLFFGGGTPSLLPVDMLARIIQTLQTRFEFLPEAEITIEANPETVSESFLEQLKMKTPVNRVSLGAQSFSEQNLKSLERLGSRESIYQAASLLKKFGYKNFNLDLIFAIPGQSEAQMLQDISEVASLEPTHVSSYNLTLKPGHPLYSKLPKDDFVAELYEKVVSRMTSLGFGQYEISNFAKPGASCEHNLLYWSGGDFLGLGPSAASRFFKDGIFHHRKAFSDFNKYLDQLNFEQVAFESSSRTQTHLEATFLELRKNDGIDLEVFSRKYGYDPSLAKQFSLFVKEGLIAKEGKKLFLTPKGRLLADLVTERLVDG